MKDNGTLVITGATKGLGRELAFYGLEHDYALALIARSKDDLEKLRAELQQNNSRANEITIHAVDLTDEIAVSKEFAMITKKHNKISVLINCAATWTGGKTITEFSVQEMKKSLDLNFFTAFNTIKSLLELPQENKTHPLTIINIGATASLRSKEGMSAFAIAKGSLRFLSQSLARELGPSGVHVAHLIIDGILDNEKIQRLMPNIPHDRLIQLKPLARSIFAVINEEPSCWTFEWDVRPYNESW